MRPQTRHSLLEFVSTETPSLALKRALSLGKVTFLGGFTRIPPGTNPGWIFEVVSEYDKRSIIAIVAQESTRQLRLRHLEAFPFRYLDPKQPIETDWLSVKEVQSYLERVRNMPRHRQSIYVWMDKGVGDEYGEKIKLQHARVEKRRLTTRNWLESFLDRSGLQV